MIDFSLLQIKYLDARRHLHRRGSSLVAPFHRFRLRSSSSAEVDRPTDRPKRSSSMESAKKGRLSSFGQRLQSLSDTFYSNILDDCQEKRVIRTVQDFEGLQEIRSNEFTFDECSTNEMKSNDDFSFTFHANEQDQRETRSKNPIEVRRRRSETDRHCLSFVVTTDAS